MTTIEKKPINNAWIDHVQTYRNEHPTVQWKDCLVEARESYTPIVPPPKKSPGEKKPNPWMVHIDEFKKRHPDWKDKMSYKELLVLCKTTYVKKAEPDESQSSNSTDSM